MATVKKIYEWLFYLIDNTITTLVDNDKIAKVKTLKTKGIDDIAARIVQERTEYRKETIVNILTMANAAKIEFLSQGEMVNDGVAIYEPTITGVFFDNTAFDEKMHRCVVNIRVTNDVHTMLRGEGRVGLTLDNGGASIDGIANFAQPELTRGHAPLLKNESPVGPFGTFHLHIFILNKV